MPDPAIPVQVQGWTWTTVFTGGSLITLVGLFVRQWLPWRKQASTEREADFARLREDVREAKSDAKQARDIAQRLENMVACMRPAISILTEEVKRLDHDSENNAALRQVRELMAMAAAGDFGFAPAMVGLATAKGKGE